MQLVEVKIQGKSFKGHFTSPEMLEKYEKSLDEAVKRAEKSMELKEDYLAVKEQCDAICKCADEILGNGSTEILFENGVDLLTCLDVFAELCEMKEKQIIPVITEKRKKYSMARARREN